MPYIAFDLDALEHVPDAARAAGVPEEAIGYGLVRLWAYCWKAKAETVTRLQLRGFFGADVVVDALVDFGHLEAVEGGKYRVRGAEKYLRISKAQSDSGKAHSANLSRGRAKVEPEPSRDPPGTQPGPTSGSAPALTPSTEHRAPNTEEKPAGDKRPRSRKRLFVVDHDADPRHQPLVKALVDACPGYTFDGGRDAKAVSQLLAKGEPDEVLARWRRALAWPKPFPTVRAIHELVQFWPHFAEPAPQRGFAEITDEDRRAHATEVGILEAP